MKKIRVTIQKYASDILKYDAIEFGVSKNFLLNYLIKNSLNFECDSLLNLDGEKEIIQFNLNKKNEDFYGEIYNASRFDTEASFVRGMIYSYISKSKVIRERFVLKKIVEKIELGIIKNKKIKIKFDDGENVVSPYNILYSNLEVSNYLFCYSEKDDEYKNYKISNIRYVYNLDEKKELGNFKFLLNVRKDFDPFLSYGKLVTIKLTEEGKRKYKVLKTNRPKLIEKKDGLWIVEGSDEKIKRYFSYFMSDVKIVKPRRLDRWFKEEAEKILKEKIKL